MLQVSTIKILLYYHKIKKYSARNPIVLVPKNGNPNNFRSSGVATPKN